MEQPKFKIGDIVRLKSGGEKMTINGYIMENPRRSEKKENFIFSGLCECVWHDKELNPKKEKYHEDALEYVNV